MSYNDPTSISVESINISSPNGKQFDITDLLKELNIYEEMNAPTLEAELILIDASSLISNLPIVGMEKIDIVFSRGPERIEKTFHTTTISNKTQVNEFTLEYTINLIEDVAMNNAVTLVSESYTGSASEIITRVAEDHLDTEIEAEPTDGNFKVVVPNWTPLYTIKWMLKRAKSANNIPFLCYATLRNGMQLRSLETLYNREPVDTFYYHRMRQDDRQVQYGDMSKARETEQTAIILTAQQEAPTLKVLSKGGYSSRSMLVDIKEKSYNTYDFNYDEFFDSGVHLDQGKAVHDTFMIRDKKLSEHYTTKQMNFVHSSQSFGESHTDFTGAALDNVPFRNTYLHTLLSYVYKVGIPGRTDLEVGDVIRLEIAKNVIKDRSNPEEFIDEFRSGRYMVIALRHKIDRSGSYHLIMDVARDTLGKQL